MSEDARYPIGKFTGPVEQTVEQRQASIALIAALPEKLRAALSGLSDTQIDTPYRESGWTVRQLIHHVADSHINAYIRFRFALTEDWPPIRGYPEKEWAMLHDALTLPVEVSLNLLDSLHRRWAVLLESLTEADWKKGYLHSENGPQSLAEVVQIYDWHGRHHTAHVTELRKRMGW